jgi:hypothetical protein
MPPVHEPVVDYPNLTGLADRSVIEGKADIPVEHPDFRFWAVFPPPMADIATPPRHVRWFGSNTAAAREGYAE